MLYLAVCQLDLQAFWLAVFMAACLFGWLAALVAGFYFSFFLFKVGSMFGWRAGWLISRLVCFIP